MQKVGFVGWRGMVGSVLMNRMTEEDDFLGIETLAGEIRNLPAVADIGGHRVAEAGGAG